MRVLRSIVLSTSPLTGRTGIRLVDQGNIVHATDAKTSSQPTLRWREMDSNY
jgi:hypothetical protein